ncbi:MAG: hypothetical protein JNM76_00660 [Betaproteobacteria bacterium]|nr:hypothetical protein [Betaproteobacteria bacterium]
MNTYLVYLKFQLMRGVHNKAQHEAEIQFLKDFLKAQEGAHWREFLGAWLGHD